MKKEVIIFIVVPLILIGMIIFGIFKNNELEDKETDSMISGVEKNVIKNTLLDLIRKDEGDIYYINRSDNNISNIDNYLKNINNLEEMDIVIYFNEFKSTNTKYTIGVKKMYKDNKNNIYSDSSKKYLLFTSKDDCLKDNELSDSTNNKCYIKYQDKLNTYEYTFISKDSDYVINNLNVIKP